MENVWFTSDLHFMHKHILEHCPDRRLKIKNGVLSNNIGIKEHDEWLIDLWNRTINKHDRIYILGDFSFGNSEETVKILRKLNGEKHLILGNHDKSSEKLTNYFVSISQIKEIKFKKNNYDFLDEDFKIVCCHYPMMSWKDLNDGVCHIHGHCHGRIDLINEFSSDLRVDVGIDGKLANFKFISLKQLYQYFKEKKRDTNLLSNLIKERIKKWEELKKISM